MDGGEAFWPYAAAVKYRREVSRRSEAEQPRGPAAAAAGLAEKRHMLVLRHPVYGSPPRHASSALEAAREAPQPFYGATNVEIFTQNDESVKLFQNTESSLAKFHFDTLPASTAKKTDSSFDATSKTEGERILQERYRAEDRLEHLEAFVARERLEAGLQYFAKILKQS